MRVAVISDIHGNLPALEAVLADIDRRGVGTIVCLGDHVAGPIDPAGVAQVLMRRDIPSVRGNHDRYLVEGRENDWAPDAFARGRLDSRQMDWQRALPLNRVVADEVFLCHGTPRNDNAMWLDELLADGSYRPQPQDRIEAEAVGYDFPVLLCGHTHVANVVRLGDGRQVVNPGSVGLPFVLRSPDARYAIIEKQDGEWSADLLSVPYDHHAAAETAAGNGFANWRNVLLTGWSRPGEL